MDSTPKLNLPYLLRSQAQANVTHNEALRMLDAFVQLSVASRTAAAPPADPAEGDAHIVGANAVDSWAGESGQIAVWQDGGWTFYTPGEGCLAWSAADGALYVRAGGSWRTVIGDALAVATLGVGTSADADNRLAVSAPASLFTHATGSHRMTINKRAPGETASLIFKDNWTGCAEIGLAGSDDLSVKVSADGQRFFEAVRIDRASGAVELPRSALLASHAVNLYGDSGRLAGAGQTGITVGAFAMPAYLSLANGSTVAGVAKFVNNNSDYGGSAGALNATVRALIDFIRDPLSRRFCAEFWVAEIRQGTGTAGGVSFRGVTYLQSLSAAARLRPTAQTFHGYLRAIDDTFLVNQAGGATVLKNGVDQAGPALIAPADGWVSVTIRERLDPRLSNGSTPATPDVYCKAAGNRWQLACPALIGGLSAVDDAIGVVPSASVWAA